MKYYNKWYLIVSMLQSISNLLDFLLIIYLVELYSRAMKVQNRKREERMQEIERNINAMIMEAMEGAKGGKDFAYDRHKWMFDYKMDLRNYM